jgi:uncharacterized protein YjbJ (UPF0337 family)
MNTDVLTGKWKQVQGEIKKKWGKLTDDDLLVVEGQHDKLVGLVQERYGYVRERAEQEVNQFLKEYSA